MHRDVWPSHQSLTSRRFSWVARLTVSVKDSNVSAWVDIDPTKKRSSPTRQSTRSSTRGEPTSTKNVPAQKRRLARSSERSSRARGCRRAGHEHRCTERATCSPAVRPVGSSHRGYPPLRSSLRCAETARTPFARSCGPSLTEGAYRPSSLDHTAPTRCLVTSA